MNSLRIKILLIVTGIIIMLSGGLSGQNNPYGMHDSLYKLYNIANAERNNPRGLVLADSLLREAVRLKDKRAQCFALVIPMKYYFNQTGTEEGRRNMYRALMALKNKAKEVGSDEDYYYAETAYVSFLMNCGMYEKAMAYAKNVMAEAKRTNNKYGIYNSYHMMGDIYSGRYDYRLSVKNYEAAYNYAKANVPSIILAPVCYTIASHYIWIDNEAEQAAKYAKMAIKITENRVTRIRSQIVLCMAYFYQGKYDEFLEQYSIIKDVADNEFSGRYWRGAKIMYYLIKKDFQRADSVNALNAPMTRSYFGSLIDIHRGVYKNAIYKLRTYNKTLDFNIAKLSKSDLILQSSDINRHVIGMRSQQLQVENERLRLQKLTLDVDAAKNEAEAIRLMSESNQMRLDKRTLETKMKARELARMKTEQKKQAVTEQNERNIMYVVIFTSCVLAVFVLIYLIRYIRKEKRLEHVHKLLVDTNDELVEARNEAETADKQKTLFLEDMSHEVRTPLNAIVGFSQILAESGDDFEEEEKADFAARIEENSELVERIIDEILQLTSIESGHSQMKTASHRVNKMCRETIESVKSLKNTGLDIRFTTDVDDEYCIDSDKNRIQNVLENLFDNAIKYTESGYVQLDCSTKKTPGFLTLTVSDTGSGIPAEEAEKIFERFYKIDTFKQGVGLGLSICKAVAGMLKGRLYVDTSYTEGARMVFEIPLS